MRNYFRPRPQEHEAAEDGGLKDRIRGHCMSADFFHAAAPWYGVLQRYTTNIARSPHVAEDTALCTVGDDDEAEVAGSAPDCRRFVLARFGPSSVADAIREKEVKKTMKAFWPGAKLRDIVTKMTANGFVLSDGFNYLGKRYVCYRFEEDGRALPVGPRVAAAPARTDGAAP